MNQNFDTAAGGAAETSKPSSPGVGRLQGLSVLASVLLPIAAAYIVFYTGIGMPDDTINQGDLIQPPVDIKGLDFVGGDHAHMNFADAEEKWRYLILPSGSCEQDCEKLLYTSRQVHIRLSEKADRVERLLVSASPVDALTREKLGRDHPRLRLVQLDKGALQRLQRQTSTENTSGARVLLVDQRGFAMMAYDNGHSGNQLLKDIKRLLKYSYEQ
ncbi:hypothetical protein [Microbulbifer litoralis]|uniref:hypothetical protein n=1 Tax=Microbulbifer litoralis TaxID=2933965 RepID=UPI0020281878|nr:hypothetical protein [Microbulbifer sp. GX H0434]